MKIQRMKNGQHFITLPKRIVILKGWTKGEELELVEARNGILILPKKHKNVTRDVQHGP